MGVRVHSFWGGGSGSGSGSGAGGRPISLAGPVALDVGQSVQWQITDYDAFAAYLVQASAGTIDIDGDIITYTAPATAGTVTLTLTVGDRDRSVSVEVLPVGVAAPTHLSPAADALDQSWTPTLQSSAFATHGQADTHAASQWRIFDGVAEVYDSGATSDLLSHVVPGGALSGETAYTWQCRHQGAALGWSPWSTPTAFTTAAVPPFDYTDPANIGQPHGGGWYVGRVVSDADGETYAIIDMGGAGDSAQLGQNTKVWGLSADFIAGSCAGAPSYLSDGRANTDAVLAHAGGSLASWGAFAAIQALNDAGGINGYTDLYLPSRDELALCYRAHKPGAANNRTGARVTVNCGGDGAVVGTSSLTVPASPGHTLGSPAQTGQVDFQTGGAEAFAENDYWSSSEAGSDWAWLQRFSDGHQSRAHKANQDRWRAVRRIRL